MPEPTDDQPDAGAMVLAVLPLVGVLGYTAAKASSVSDSAFFTHSMRAVAEVGPHGGAYHAIIGTLEQVGIAALISVPFGIMVAVYLVRVQRGPARRVVSFFVDVMTGLPSIVAGLFIPGAVGAALHQGILRFRRFAGPGDPDAAHHRPVLREMLSWPASLVRRRTRLASQVDHRGAHTSCRRRCPAS